MGQPRSVEVFPYPKPSGGVRQFVHGDALDELALRYIASDVVTHADSLVPDRVLTYRLERQGSGWRCRHAGNDVRRRRESVCAFAMSSDFGGLGVGDVRSYYGSIPRVQLGELIIDAGASPAEAGRLLGWIDACMERASVSGIPIGPEASGLLANLYLLPLDHELARMGLNYFRVMDDFWVLAASELQWSEALKVGDFVLQALGLTRADEKTIFMRDPEEAYLYALDGVLSAIDAAFAASAHLGLQAVRNLVDFIRAEPDPAVAHFRYAVRSSRRLEDQYAAELLEDRPDLIQIDPRAAGDYIRVLARRKRSYVEPFLAVAADPINDRTMAVQLHLLRAFIERSWGRAEGALFEQRVADASLPGRVRAFAILARARTPGWSASDAVDVATANLPLDIRRAAVAGLRWIASDKTRRAAAAHCAMKDADLVPTSHWVMAS